MGDEAKVVKIKVSADGTKEAADGLSKVADQLDRQKAAVKAMDDALAASGYLARLAAYKAEAAALNAEQDKSANTIKKLSAAVNENSQAFGDQSTKLRSQLGAGAGAISQLSQAFAQVVPEVGAFQNALDIGLRSMGGFLGVLGGGPGIVLGGAVAALGLLGSVMSSAKKEADDLAKSTAENTSAFGEYLDKINEARSAVSASKGKETSEKTLQDELARGKASLDQYDAEIAVLSKKLADNEALMKVDVGMSWDELKQRSSLIIPQLKLENEGYKEQLAVLKERRDVAREYSDAEKKNALDKKALDDALAAAGASGTKARTFDMNAPESFTAKPRKDEASLFQSRQAANRAALDAIDKMEADSAQKRVDTEREIQQAAFARELEERKGQLEQLNRQFAALENDKTALVATDLDAQKRLLESQIGETVSTLHAQDAEQAVQAEQLKRDALNETRDEFMRLEDEKADKIQETIAAEKTARVQINQSLMSLSTTLGQLTAKQLSEAVKGHKIQAALILEGIGDAMVAEGVRVMFQGGASLLMGNYVGGGGLLALGAAEIGVGLGLGAAGAAAQPPQPAGSGEPTTSPASPVRDNSSSSNGDQRGPTVIYIDMPTVVSPSADDGMRIRQAIDAASRVYGAPV